MEKRTQSLRTRSTLNVVRCLANGCSRAIAPFLFSVLDSSSCTKLRINNRVDGIAVVDKSADDPNRIILYIHGGAFFFGSVWTHREFLGRLSAATRAHVVAVNYRLAPEDPFPAGLDDTFSAWQWLREQYPEASIAIAGDSAGGNLAFALMVRLAQRSMEQPTACIAISPWLILDCDSRFWRRLAQLYLQGHPPDDPLVSPTLASDDIVKQFPPVLIHADKDEFFCPDAQAMAELCQRSGVPVDFKLYTGTTHGFHVWPWRFQQETREAMELIRSFLDRHWGMSTPTTEAANDGLGTQPIASKL